MRTPGSTVAFAPIAAPSSITGPASPPMPVGGYRSFVSTTCGPRKTRSPITVFVGMKAIDWIETSEPITDRPSQIAFVPSATRSPIRVCSRIRTLCPVWKSSPISTSQ